MKMILIRYVDIIDTVPTEGGYIEKVILNNATIPIVLDPSRICPIQPYFSKTGRPYKNVSYVTHDGDVYKVVGNYKELSERVKESSKESRLKITGYRND